VNGGIRVLVGVADVDADSPSISHRSARGGATTTVYTGIRTFSMLPEQLSTGLTSLNEAADRLAVVVDMVSPATARLHPLAFIAPWCEPGAVGVQRRGGWLEGTSGAPPKVGASADLQAQLKLQTKPHRCSSTSAADWAP